MNPIPTIYHVELTSRCNKNCWMCGRRKMERDYPELCDWGDMPLELVRKVAGQIPDGAVVQLHNNGEPLLYPALTVAMWAFPQTVLQLNTNGKLLVEKSDSIIGELDVLTVSVIENDPEWQEQLNQVTSFIDIKGDDRPRMVYRLLGNIDPGLAAIYEKLPGVVARRTLHDPDGSRNYRRPAVVPEIGICLDLLTHMAIDRHGNISLCVRFDPAGDLRLGNINQITLEEAIHGEKRARYIREHIDGNRDKLPGCWGCDFWGVPTA